MAYKDVLIPLLVKWGDRVAQYGPNSMGYNQQKYTTSMLVYDTISEKTPEEALQILKYTFDFTEQVAERTKYHNTHMLDEGIEDVKKLMNYHNKFRKTLKKKRAYIDSNDREEKFRQSLMQMTADKLYVECKRYIILSAYAMAMNNPSSDYHMRVMDCYNECQRRGNPQLYHAVYSEVHNMVFGKGRKTMVKRPVKKSKTTTRRKK